MNIKVFNITVYIIIIIVHSLKKKKLFVKHWTDTYLYIIINKLTVVFKLTCVKIKFLIFIFIVIYDSITLI